MVKTCMLFCVILRTHIHILRINAVFNHTVDLHAPRCSLHNYSNKCRQSKQASIHCTIHTLRKSNKFQKERYEFT